MSTKEIKDIGNTNEQLDIMDEAIDLELFARGETRELEFSQALEILKIQRIDNLCKKLDTVNENLEAIATRILAID